MATASSSSTPLSFEAFLDGVKQRNPNEREFVQAVKEVARSVFPLVETSSEYREARILERLTEPDRIITFRVTWEDDDGGVHVNRAWRVQHSRSIGPYKGGLRFHRSVDRSILKFLAYEQTFKNSLTGLPMGGGKGGSNFDPKERTEREIMRFCQSFMSELFRHIGDDADVPAGDIGVGSREIGYLFGQYMRLTNEYEGALTGKGLTYGGSAVRQEATGYGAVYFLCEMLACRDESIEGKRIAISGAGNVALFAAEKALAMGAKVITLSDSDGFVSCDAGFDEDALETVKNLKLEKRGRLAELDDRLGGVRYVEGGAPWGVECDVAMPCATQNEIDLDAARSLIDHGVCAIVEGANMPCTDDAVQAFREAQLLFAPGKAANAGGVAVSGLEQSQNASRLSWERERVDDRLQEIMGSIHAKCVEEMEADGCVDYVDAANRAGFRKVADAMLAQGIF
jgi:glutamate dehydrogenase (NADP+)